MKWPLLAPTAIAIQPDYNASTGTTLIIRETNESEPVLDMKRLDVTIRTEQQPAGPILIVDPITLAEHEALTPEICNEGLQETTIIFRPIDGGAGLSRQDHESTN